MIKTSENFRAELSKPFRQGIANEIVLYTNMFITSLLSFKIKSEHLPIITQDSFLAKSFINSDSWTNNSSAFVKL